ncbi:MAG: hypothetical protein HYX90_06410 [Chloroflexi bacterium]|nr:hypothetical protein [Chloroflexota bacterium]
MRGKTLRVVVASEDPGLRQMLAGVAEGEQGAVVVGRAENAVNAVALAARLRPQVTLVDSELPHYLGKDSVRLSRMSGLDAALSISRELPSAATVVISNSRYPVHAGESAGNPQLIVYGESRAGGIPMTLRELVGATSPGNISFGGLRIREEKTDAARLTRLADRTVLGGSLALMGGLGLMATLLFAGPGLVVAAAGVAAIALGFIGKLSTGLWRKRSKLSDEKLPQPVTRDIESSSGGKL